MPHLREIVPFSHQYLEFHQSGVNIVWRWQKHIVINFLFMQIDWKLVDCNARYLNVGLFHFFNFKIQFSHKTKKIYFFKNFEALSQTQHVILHKKLTEFHDFHFICKFVVLFGINFHCKTETMHEIKIIAPFSFFFMFETIFYRFCE